jgi:hypothetical protein
VFTAVEQRRIQYSVLTASDAVVPIRIDFLALVKSILQVLPETKNVLVITGASPIERFWQGEIRREVMSLADRVSLTFYDGLSFEDILKHTTELPPHSAILWESMIVDAAGVVYDADASFKRLHAVAKARILAITRGGLCWWPLHRSSRYKPPDSRDGGSHTWRREAERDQSNTNRICDA